jgi:hypothetical protein
MSVLALVIGLAFLLKTGTSWPPDGDMSGSDGYLFWNCTGGLKIKILSY